MWWIRIQPFGEDWLVASYIESLNGLNINDQFVVDSNGNVSFSGVLSGNVLKALRAEISNLSAIKADLGVVTAGTIKGVTINGSTFNTTGSNGNVTITNDTITNDSDTGGTSISTATLNSGTLGVEKTTSNVLQGRMNLDHSGLEFYDYNDKLIGSFNGVSVGLFLNNNPTFNINKDEMYVDSGLFNVNINDGSPFQIRPDNCPTSGGALFKVVSCGGSERFVVEHDGMIKTSNNVFRFDSGASIDAAGGSFRSKYNNNNYTSVGNNLVDMYLANDLAFRFTVDTGDNYHRIIDFGSRTILKGLNGSSSKGGNIQARNGNDTAYGVFTASDFAVGSSESLKENMVPMEEALDKLLGLDILTYNYKNAGEEIKIGATYEQALEVFPEITRKADGDFEGGINQSSTLNAVIKSIQELAAFVGYQTS